MSTVPLRSPDLFATIFLLGRNFFFNIYISEYLIEASEVSTVPTPRLERFATIFIFRSKFFFLISICDGRNVNGSHTEP